MPVKLHVNVYQFFFPPELGGWGANCSMVLASGSRGVPCVPWWVLGHSVTVPHIVKRGAQIRMKRRNPSSSGLLKHRLHCLSLERWRSGTDTGQTLRFVKCVRENAVLI
jgi:hypothetical protein